MFTDRAALTSRGCGDQGPLAARLAIYEHQRDRVDLPGRLRGLAEEDLPAGVTWATFLDRVQARVADEVERTGTWTMHSHVGVFTCR